VDFYFECRYRTMAQCAASASAARRNAWSIHITAGRMPGAASAKSGLSHIEFRFDLTAWRSAGRARIHQP